MHNKIHQIILLCVAGMGLAACAGGLSSIKQNPPPADDPMIVQSVPPIQLDTSPLHQGSAFLDPQSSPPPSYPKPARESHPISRDALMNIDASQLTALLGAPNFIRKEGKSEVWHYQQQACLGVFYLYAIDPAQDQQGMERLGGRVEWIDMLDHSDHHSNNHATTDSCLVAYAPTG
ncbi:MAG: hypothetical protein AB8B77_08485 [Alphaproteobacteria bacterium]